MTHTTTRSSSRLAAAVLTIFSGIALSGCRVDDALLDDTYEPVSVTERYPITVKKMPVRTGIVANSGALKPDQVNAVIMFANQAVSSGLSGVTVKYPSGSRNRAPAQEIAGILERQGIPQGMIRVTSYHGKSSQPIQLSYNRKVAVTKECGDWSRNLASERSNELPPNFGCSFQHNLAAMVANPADFEQPRSMAPVMASNRDVVMDVYVANSTAGDYFVLDDVNSN